ncbi:MAG: T9SS type A sorting domain-containing protein [Flavipsychrobacter sp.]|nr:T9SS type A sorting domain-containing protein [Flavipsychrobacter sp.]
MKKRILLFTLTASIGYLSLSSYKAGLAYHSGLNRTGAQASSATCGGSGCHGGNSTNTTVSITLDSAGGVPVTGYTPGASYTVVIKGTNTSSLPQFGFQYSTVSGTGAAQVQAGTSTAPSGGHIYTVAGIRFVEHSSPMAGTSGTYTVSFPWTAPASGAGVVTMYCTLNAVNGDGSANNTDLSANTSITLTEYPLGLKQLSQSIGIKAFPNPATNQFSIKIDNAIPGIYNINVYNMSGQIMSAQNLHTTGNVTETTVDCSNWPKGYYGVQIIQNGAQRLLPIVKM